MKPVEELMTRTLESYHTLDPAQPSGLGAPGGERAQDYLLSFKAAIKLFSAHSQPVQCFACSRTYQSCKPLRQGEPRSLTAHLEAWHTTMTGHCVAVTLIPISHLQQHAFVSRKRQDWPRDCSGDWTMIPLRVPAFPAVGSGTS